MAYLRRATSPRTTQRENTMNEQSESEVAHLSSDLDHLLSTFFSHRGWRTEVGVDREESTIEVIVRLSNRRLSRDDRFLSLIEEFTAMRSSRVLQRTGLSLQSRLFSADGDEITSTLHRRGQLYLTDASRATQMRRRLTRLGLWRRFLLHILPNSLLWLAALLFVVYVIGLSLILTVVLASAAMLLQSLILLRIEVRDEMRRG